MSNSGSSSGIVILATVTMGGLAFVKDTTEGKPSVRPVVTGFVLGAILLLVNTFSPYAAKWLSIMGIIGAMVDDGPAVFGKLGGIA